MVLGSVLKPYHFFRPSRTPPPYHAIFSTFYNTIDMSPFGVHIFSSNICGFVDVCSETIVYFFIFGVDRFCCTIFSSWCHHWLLVTIIFFGSHHWILFTFDIFLCSVRYPWFGWADVVLGVLRFTMCFLNICLHYAAAASLLCYLSW